MKEPLRTQLIEWHKAHEIDVFDFAKEIHEYSKADVQLLKSGCIKFRNAFITDTGIDPLQSCTIAGACMNVLRTSHLKPNSIGRVPVNGSSSSSCHQTSVFHLSMHFFAVSLNLLRSFNEQGCARRVHYIMCAVLSVARPHSQVVSPL